MNVTTVCHITPEMPHAKSLCPKLKYHAYASDIMVSVPGYESAGLISLH